MSSRTLLLFAHQDVELAIIGRALREVEYLVFPARFHEGGIDALVRVSPDLVLIEASHHGSIITPEFSRRVAELGAQVLIYTRHSAPEDAAVLQALEPFPYPVLEFTGDGRALAALMLEVQQRAA